MAKNGVMTFMSSTLFYVNDVDKWVHYKSMEEGEKARNVCGGGGGLITLPTASLLPF